jgi:uncharacterized protein YcfJ
MQATNKAGLSNKELTMKHFLGMIAALALSAPSFAGVSVSVGEPGFYGRIDIGGLPPPRLVYSQPIVVDREPAGVVRAPIYLRVPPGHAKHWHRHCAQYNACGERVYFVQDAWYSDVYVPRYQRRAYRVAEPAPAYAYAEPPRERLYTIPVSSVRAVVGPPEQHCWVERRQVVEDRGDVNVPGAIVGAVIGGVLGHQVGGGRGRDVATVGGAVAGGAIGANVGRGGQVYGEDVQRCATVQRHAHADYWNVTYNFRGVMHRVQMSAPPGRTITVDEGGAPRG